MSKFIVYALVDSRNQETFYVGKSCSGMDKAKRHTRPWSFNDHNQEKIDRVKEILAAGATVDVVVLDTARNAVSLLKKETKLIKRFIRQGKPLLNKVNRGRRAGKVSSGLLSSPTHQTHQLEALQPLPSHQENHPSTQAQALLT